jgi:hypothetical protein
VQVLKECIARAGSLEEGLRYYVGAANLADDGGYVAKVLAEQGHLRRVADGKVVAVNVPLLSPAPPVAPSRPAPTVQESLEAPASPPPQTSEDEKTEERVALLRAR